MNKNKEEVFIVTSRYYPDGIEKVFSTREKAEEYIDTSSHDCNIEVHKIDEPVKRESKVYCVKFGLINKGEAEVESGSNQVKDLIKINDDGYNARKISIFVESDSRNYAVKIASDRYNSIIANEKTMYPYLRARIIKTIWGTNDTSFYDFFTGEMVLTSQDKADIDLPDFIKVAARQIKLQ